MKKKKKKKRGEVTYLCVLMGSLHSWIGNFAFDVDFVFAVCLSNNCLLLDKGKTLRKTARFVMCS